MAESGWFREAPSDAIERWSLRGAIVLIAGFVGLFLAFNLPSSGLLLVAAAAIVGAVVMFIVARVMPQRTLEGARTFAQLAAYRRTLQKTLEQSRTMEQVVASGALPWVDTPDQAVVWAYALGPPRGGRGGPGALAGGRADRGRIADAHVLPALVRHR